MQRIEFKGEGRERLEIAIRGYERARTGEYYDDNWINVEVTVDCGSFRGKFQATFQTSEIEHLHSQLAVLQESLKGQVEFHTLEDQLSLLIRGDGLGHIEIEGEALDQPGIGNRLNFRIAMDQTQLSTAVRSVKEAVSAYPVRT